jgi:hypothetical protein
MHIGLQAKYLLFFSDFNETIFSIDFGKMVKHQISGNSVKWEPSFCMRPSIQVDSHDEASRSFANAAKILVLRSGLLNFT